MDNKTAIREFHIVAFYIPEEKQLVLFFIFSLVYFIGILGNSVIIAVIYKDSHLHTPMYIFLSNLSFVDICYTTATLPKLMDILLSGNNLITFGQIFTHMYFFLLMGITEVILLTSMAYDRYAAICHPLHYHRIMSRNKCVLVLANTWICGSCDSLFLTVCVSRLSFCHSNNIQQFFCDIKAVAQTACAGKEFYIIVIVNITIFGLFPFLLSLTSYIKIITRILHIPSTNGRKKAFSTCTSHLTVLILFYGAVLWTYMRPPSDNSGELDQLFSITYLELNPMLNPLIYSLRNKDVLLVLMRSVPLKKNEDNYEYYR